MEIKDLPLPPIDLFGQNPTGIYFQVGADIWYLNKLTKEQKYIVAGVARSAWLDEKYNRQTIYNVHYDHDGALTWCDYRIFEADHDYTPEGKLRSEELFDQECIVCILVRECEEFEEVWRNWANE